MVGQRIGYVRVSTLDQDEKRQLESQVLDRVLLRRPLAGTRADHSSQNFCATPATATQSSSIAWTDWPANWTTFALSSKDSPAGEYASNSSKSSSSSPERTPP